MICISTLHDRLNCDKAFANSEITEDQWCAACRAEMEIKMRAQKEHHEPVEEDLVADQRDQ